MDARQLALDVLRRVFTQSAFIGPSLRVALQTHQLQPNDRALATELIYGVVRRRGHLDRAIRQASGRRLKDLNPRTHDILRIAAYQIIFLDRVPNHAAVNAAVEQTKARLGSLGAKRVNQILRKLSDTPEEALYPRLPVAQKEPIQYLAAVGSVNADVSEILLNAYGLEHAQKYLLASLEPAPHTLRVNQLRASTEKLIEELDATKGCLPYSVRLKSSLRLLPAELNAVQEGLASPQDEASMRVVELLDPQPEEHILDICSAPGGKTTHTAEKMKDRGRIVAYDRHPNRLEQVRQNIQRLGLNCVEVCEVLPPKEESFHRVLVDAPCAGLGTLRRHPEIRWRFKKADLEQLCTNQAKILTTASQYVRQGGVLLYSVCSVSKEEGLEQVANLSGFKLDSFIQTDPSQDGQPDGFFAAKLLRTA